MPRPPTLVAVLLLVGAPVYADEVVDPLTRARTAYNNRQFDAAIAAAEQARLSPAVAHRADLIGARAFLERYRRSADRVDLTGARDRLRRIDPEQLDARERTEFVVGLGEALYFDESYGAAAEVFAAVLDGGTLPGEARERVLDWWAIAIDRDAWTEPQPEQQATYRRIQTRMRDELADRPGSTTAGYWLAASARSQGDFQAAWDAAEAGWVRAVLAPDGGAALRAEIDQLMQLAIVPERARAQSQPVDALRLEWEQFKERWATRR